MKLTLSVQEFVKSIVMDPGWKKARIKEVTREQNKARTGMNTIVVFEVENGVLPSGGVDLREVKQWYSDAYPANWVPLLEAIYDKSFTLDTFTEDVDFDPMNFIDIYVWAEITREAILDQNTKKDTGRMQNGIKSFLHISNNPV